MGNYGLQRAQDDVASLRGQLAHLLARGVTLGMSDASVITKTNPLSLVDITVAWPIVPGDLQVSTLYVLEAEFNGLWEASGALNLGWDLDGTLTNLTPVAAGLATAGHTYGGVIRLYLQIVTTGAGGTYNIWSDGGITDTSAARAGATSAVLFGISTGNAIDTTAAHTLAACADFGVSNASQTIITHGSNFRVIDWLTP